MSDPLLLCAFSYYIQVVCKGKMLFEDESHGIQYSLQFIICMEFVLPYGWRMGKQKIKQKKMEYEEKKKESLLSMINDKNETTNWFSRAAHI